MNIDPERKKHPLEPLTCICGDRADHFCGKVHPHADATERQCWWILCWLVVIGTFAAAGLVMMGGCR
jgi:hypothetical protein